MLDGMSFDALFWNYAHFSKAIEWREKWTKQHCKKKNNIKTTLKLISPTVFTIHCYRFELKIVYCFIYNIHIWDSFMNDTIFLFQRAKKMFRNQLYSFHFVFWHLYSAFFPRFYQHVCMNWKQQWNRNNKPAG